MLQLQCILSVFVISVLAPKRLVVYLGIFWFRIVTVNLTVLKLDNGQLMAVTI